MARGRPSKKSEIVLAACELFTRQGYQATSIDQVVAAAGVSKPTVYSNFPTKLVLWEEVLQHIESSANQAMVTHRVFDAASSRLPLDSWLAIWETWLSCAENLAVYRIFLGEQHKMSDDLMTKFDQFESVLIMALQAWQKHFQVSSQVYLQMEALSRQYQLMPALRRIPIDKKQCLIPQLDWLLSL